MSLGKSSLMHFKHGGDSYTGVLQPLKSGELDGWEKVHAACLRALPHCKNAQNRDDFAPHLTIGQFTSEKEVK